MKKYLIPILGLAAYCGCLLLSLSGEENGIIIKSNELPSIADYHMRTTELSTEIDVLQTEVKIFTFEKHKYKAIFKFNNLYCTIPAVMGNTCPHYQAKCSLYREENKSWVFLGCFDAVFTYGQCYEDSPKALMALWEEHKKTKDEILIEPGNNIIASDADDLSLVLIDFQATPNMEITNTEEIIFYDKNGDKILEFDGNGNIFHRKKKIANDLAIIKGLKDFFKAAGVYSEEESRSYPATLIKIVDGDTMDLAVDLGFNLTLKGRFRILDLDTYESRLIRGTTPEEKAIGIRAKKYAADLLNDQPLKVIIYSWKKDPYGRWLGKIKFNGKDYAAEMKKQGFQKGKK